MTEAPIYFINLDRAKARAAFLRQSFEECGLLARVTRVPAIDHRKDTFRQAYRKTLFTRQWTLNRSELACFESHRRVWEMFLQTEAPQCVILEDDVVFGPGFAAVLTDLTAHVDGLDCIKLDGVPSPFRVGAPEPRGSVALRTIRSITFSSAAYLLSRNGAKKLLRETEQYCDPLDHLMFVPTADWCVRQVDPAICVQAMFLSEEGRAAYPDEITHSDRLDGSFFMDVETPVPWWFRKKNDLDAFLRQAVPNALWRDRLLKREGGETSYVVPLVDNFAQYRW